MMTITGHKTLPISALGTAGIAPRTVESLAGLAVVVGAPVSVSATAAASEGNP